MNDRGEWSLSGRSEIYLSSSSSCSLKKTEKYLSRPSALLKWIWPARSSRSIEPEIQRYVCSFTDIPVNDGALPPSARQFNAAVPPESLTPFLFFDSLLFSRQILSRFSSSPFPFSSPPIHRLSKCTARFEQRQIRFPVGENVRVKSRVCTLECK